MKKTVLSFLIAVVLLLVAGTFFDLPIGGKLYNLDSGFAKIFATIGMYPELIAIILSPAMILSVLYVKRKNISIVCFIVIFVVLICFEVLYSNDIRGYLSKRPLGTPGAAAILVCIIAACSFLLLPLAKKNPKEMFFVGLTGIAAIFIGKEILNTLKAYWGRQRFYTMDDPALQFTPWYLPQGKGRGESFRSFPSGHSFASMLAVWLSLWPRFIEPIKKYTKLIFTAAILFALATMFSRIVYGRHFLSDVTAGASLSLASMALAVFLCDKYSEKIYKLVFPKSNNSGCAKV
jgi:membrane-associated phospholipid phosphatase